MKLQLESWNFRAACNLIVNFFVRICTPHSSIMMQRPQTENDRGFNDDVALVSRKKSSENDYQSYSKT